MAPCRMASERYDVVIRNGRVVTGGSEFHADIGIAGSTIAQLGGSMAGIEEIDATDRWVLPGGIDAHVHLTPPGTEPGSWRWVDDFEVGTRAAAAGRDGSSARRGPRTRFRAARSRRSRSRCPWSLPGRAAARTPAAAATRQEEDGHGLHCHADRWSCLCESSGFSSPWAFSCLLVPVHPGAGVPPCFSLDFRVSWFTFVGVDP